MMRRLSLSQRLALVFTSLLLLCAAAVCLVQLYTSAQYGNAMVQRLSAGLAQQIVAREPLLDAQGHVDRQALKPLFDRLMVFNPSVELYLVSPDGELLADAAPPGHIKRQRIDLAPVQAFLSGAALALRRCARRASCAAISILFCRAKPLTNWRPPPGRRRCGACCCGRCCWWRCLACWRAGWRGSGSRARCVS